MMIAPVIGLARGKHTGRHASSNSSLLPFSLEPRPDHAPAMARFAYECLNKMHDLVARLEEALGPDTAGKIAIVSFEN